MFLTMWRKWYSLVNNSSISGTVLVCEGKKGKKEKKKERKERKKNIIVRYCMTN